MIRSRLLWLKPPLYALFALAMLCCLTEVGLRVYDSMTGQVTRRMLYDRGMVCKSWFVHHSLKPSQTFAVKNPDSGAQVRLALNSFGLRGQEPGLPKPPGLYRILCLGDEATLAPHIPESDTFCARLQALLQARTRLKIEVINAGVPDYCPLLALLQLKHQLIGLRPDLVILNFDMSDVGDDYHYRRHTVVDATGLPSVCAHPDLEAPKVLARATADDLLLLPQWSRQHLGGFWAKHMLVEKPRSIDSPQGRYLWLEDHPPDWSVYITQTLSPVLYMHELLRGEYATLIVGTVPAPWQVSATASDGGQTRSRAGVPKGTCFQSKRPFEIVGEFCRTNHIPVCNPTPVFQSTAQPERLYLNNAPLFSPEGHAIYARELARFVEDALPGIWGDGSAQPTNTFPQARAR